MYKASIIIPAYNSGQYIAKTIESILSQTYSDFECIVIDDGSKDNTLEVVRAFKDPRVKVISLPNSGGPAIPRNTGIAAAKGEYIVMFDSDDIMHPHKLELSISVLEKNLDADFLFTNFASIDEQDKIITSDFLQEYDSLWNMIGGKPSANAAVLIPARKIYPALVKVNFVGTSSVVLRKSSLSVSDVFNEDLKNSDDRLFWILFTKQHNAIYLHAILHQYRIQSNSISNQGFVRRGPSKIKALIIVLNDCTDMQLKKTLINQIAKDYEILAFSYQQKGDKKNALKSMLTVFKYQLSLAHFMSLIRLCVKLLIK
ncbi:MAG: glycosyltransferase family 2 protein [Chitinophagaceae bacterium]|nr:MAG: glycosyltransferase family 2 protein [Chitinophagaceae bacterium]